MNPCDHKFAYQGLVTWPSRDPRPGSGAHDRIYADAYFCERCCGLRLTNEREMGHTYEKAHAGAVEYANKPKGLI